MHPKITKALQVVVYVYGQNWFRDPNFYDAKKMLRDRLKAAVFIHPQDNEMLAFIDGEMHRTPIVVA